MMLQNYFANSSTFQHPSGQAAIKNKILRYCNLSKRSGEGKSMKWIKWWSNPCMSYGIQPAQWPVFRSRWRPVFEELADPGNNSPFTKHKTKDEYYETAAKSIQLYIMIKKPNENIQWITYKILLTEDMQCICC